MKTAKYCNVDRSALASQITEAFRLNASYGGAPLVEVRRYEGDSEVGELSITVHGDNVFAELVAADNGVTAVKWTYTDSGMQRTVIVKPNGDATCTVQDFSPIKGLNGDVRTGELKPGDPNRVRSIAQRVLAIARPLAKE